MSYPKEWTQKEFLQNKKSLAKDGIEVLLIDTILNPIQKATTQTYNPFELSKEADGTVFVFYCDSGKATLDRLQEYQNKFPNNPCLSLKGGRAYWRKNMMILDD